jgi:hypothetical protein
MNKDGQFHAATQDFAIGAFGIDETFAGFEIVLV